MPIDALGEPLFQGAARRKARFMRQARNVGYHGRRFTVVVGERSE